MIGISAAVGVSEGIPVSGSFYARIEVVKGSFQSALMWYESVLPKRAGVDLYVRGSYAEDGTPCGDRVSQIYASLNYNRTINEVWVQSPANRSRSG